MRNLSYTIIIGDSRNMEEIPNNSVHLVVTSPPYWNLEQYSTVGRDPLNADLGRIQDKDEFFRELTKVWRECYRVLVPGGKLVCIFRNINVGSRVFGYPRMINLYGPMVESLEIAGFIFLTEWISKVPFRLIPFRKVMDRTYGNRDKTEVRSLYNYDYCVVFKKGVDKRIVNVDVSKDEWYYIVDGVWEVWDIGGTEYSEYVQGAAHPVKLFEQFIRIYTEPGEVVLDPFLGTGTAVLAAFNLDRSGVGYEVRPEMESIIKKKVKFGSKKLNAEVRWIFINKITGKEEVV